MINRLLKDNIAKNLARVFMGFIIFPDKKFKSLVRQLSADKRILLGFREIWNLSLCLIVIEQPDRSAIHAETKHDRLNLQPLQVFLSAIGRFGLVYEAFAPANKNYSYIL